VQLAGHDIGAVIDQITAAPMDGARSISSVLYGRLQQLQLPNLGHDVTWAQRTPKDAPAVAHELAAGLDQRARALGEQLAASPEPWLAKQLGMLAPHASPLLREDYARRAAAAAAYREAAGITDPDQAEQIVLAYLRRWGSEEATRALKLLTGVEDFRVRKWESIQRLTFLAMMTCGVQALMLITRARTATRYIARIPQFFDNVLLKNYRLWEGIADALLNGA